MSYTLTVTQPLVQQQALTLQVTSQISTKAKICLLIEKVKSSLLFSPVQQKFLQELSLKFDAEYFKDFGTDEGKENASLALSLFVSEVIYPAIRKETDEARQNELLDLEDAIKSILSEILPRGTDPEVFINENDQFSHEQATLQENLLIIEECFRNQMKELFSLANTTNQQLKQSFEILKQRLLELNRSRKTMGGDLCKQLDSLTSQVDSLSKQLENEAVDIQEIGKKMKNEQHNFQQLMKTCQTIFKKI